MSDTRAAIRELRSLSEKRSLSALTEAEAARWASLRRQLGLPAEPVAATAPAGEAPVAALPLQTGRGSGPETLVAAPLDPAEETQGSASGSPQETVWTGPALDSPAAPSAHGWGGPSLDAPAWSDAVAERPTDPGLDEPPPIPFDEAPAVPRRHEDTEVSEFGGSPEEPVPLATASDFVSYRRDGTEAIDLPADTGLAAELESQSLAQLAAVAPSPPLPMAMHAAVGFAEDSPTQTQPEVEDDVLLAAELERESASPADAEGVSEGVLPEPPLEATSPEALGVDPVLPAPEGVPLAESLGVYEGVLAEPDVGGDNQPSAAEDLADGALSEPPPELDAGAPADADASEERPLLLVSAATGEGVLPEPPVQLDPFAPADEAAPSAPPVQLDSEGEGVLPEPPLQLDAFALKGEGVIPEPPLQLDRAGDGVIPEPPLRLDAFAPQDEGVIPEPPLQLDTFALEGEGVSLEPPLRLESIALPDEGVLPEPMLELRSLVLPDEGVIPEPLRLDSPLPEAAAESVLAEGPPPASTWAPGAGEPPVLAGNDFAPGGAPLGERGPDPWPEALAPEVPAEDVVETIGDEDVVEDLATPTQIAFPPSAPPGSGGIRGFQFPRPPTGPESPAVPDAQAARPPVSSMGRPVGPPAAPRRTTSVSLPVPPASPPQPPAPPIALRTPVPPPRPAPPPPSPMPLRTPVPAGPPPAPIPASAVAPVTPRPVPPAGPGSVVPRPTPLPGRLETVLAPPAPPAPPPPPAAVADDDPEYTTQPLLDLVDEVEPARPPPPTRAQPRPSPPSGTPAVFGTPMMLNPNFVEGEHRVVIHTLEGQVHRGTVHNVDLQDEALVVKQPDGRSVELSMRRLKAVFFVLAPGERPLPARGERVQVTFRDGRQVVGYSDDHATGEPGFFVVPSDARTNTARVYVFRGGVQSITTG